MENASKALIMAASVLIGVVILSLTVYLYTTFSTSIQENNKQIEDDQIQQFNNKFLAYEEKSGTLTIYDVVTVANMARENNASYDLNEAKDSNFYIIVNFKGNKIQTYTNDELKSTFLDNDYYIFDSSDSSKLEKYKCKVKLNENTGRVNQIEFK